jgi:dCTP diphosphatase
MAMGGLSRDETTTLAELKSAILKFVHERDWERFHNPKNLSMALAAEAAELMEHFLWDTPEASEVSGKSEAVADELADIIVYAIEFANSTGIDIAGAIETKMQKNALKYPIEKAKGNALKYTELDKGPETGD